jgi:hypothetical protein
MATAEVTKVFGKTGRKASGGKQDAANGAAMTVVKLLVQSNCSVVQVWTQQPVTETDFHFIWLV